MHFVIQQSLPCSALSNCVELSQPFSDFLYRSPTLSTFSTSLYLSLPSLTVSNFLQLSLPFSALSTFLKLSRRSRASSTSLYVSMPSPTFSDFLKHSLHFSAFSSFLRLSPPSRPSSTSLYLSLPSPTFSTFLELSPILSTFSLVLLAASTRLEHGMGFMAVKALRPGTSCSQTNFVFSTHFDFVRRLAALKEQVAGARRKRIFGHVAGAELRF